MRICEISSDQRQVASLGENRSFAGAFLRPKRPPSVSLAAESSFLSNDAIPAGGGFTSLDMLGDGQ